MFLFVKLWNPKQAWFALSEAERQEFIAKGQEAMLKVSEKGIETIGWMELRNEDNHQKSGYQYCSVYRVKDRYVAIQFHNTMEKFGWYDYFEQVNAVGKIESPGTLLGRIVALKKKSWR